jgi:glutamate/tyrosine decarboxylase-like PLP-dependent enzyme
MFKLSSTHDFKNLDLNSQIDAFRKNVPLVIDYICNYANTVTSKPIAPDIKPGYLRELLPAHAPEDPEDFKDMLDDFDKLIIPGTLHWVHPDMYAYFPCGSGYPNILADMLTSVTGGVGFSWTSQPALTELENVMMDWMGRALTLPSHFIFEDSRGKGGGTIMPSASDAIFSCVTSARYRALEALGSYDKDGEMTDLHPGLPLQKLICYTSTEGHSSIEKAANLNLVDIHIIPPNERFQLTGDMIEKYIKEDLKNGLIPFMIVATLGSTGGVCFDDVASIGPIAQKYNCWLHVDGAYGGNSLILPEMKHLRNGLEYVDTFETNPLKMLNGSVECSCLWIRDVHQYKKPYLIDATYLIDEFEGESDEIMQANIEYRHYGVPLSKRMRATKLWFLLRQFGISGIQKNVRNMISMAKHLEQLVRADKRFEVTNLVELGVVCFRQRPNETSQRLQEFEGVDYCDAQNMNLLHRINKSNKIHICPSTLRGTLYTLRFSVNYLFATKADIERAWKVCQSYIVDELDAEFAETLAPSKLVQDNEFARRPSLPLSFGPVKVGRKQEHQQRHHHHHHADQEADPHAPANNDDGQTKFKW